MSTALTFLTEVRSRNRLFESMRRNPLAAIGLAVVVILLIFALPGSRRKIPRQSTFPGGLIPLRPRTGSARTSWGVTFSRASSTERGFRCWSGAALWLRR
jgi:hypothetical protein